MSEKNVVSRSVAIVLAVITIVLLVSLVGVITNNVFIIN
jgi:hypothetical protein